MERRQLPDGSQHSFLEPRPPATRPRQPSPAEAELEEAHDLLDALGVPRVRQHIRLRPCSGFPGRRYTCAERIRLWSCPANPLQGEG